MMFNLGDWETGRGLHEVSGVEISASGRRERAKNEPFRDFSTVAGGGATGGKHMSHLPVFVKVVGTFGICPSQP